MALAVLLPVEAEALAQGWGRSREQALGHQLAGERQLGKVLTVVARLGQMAMREAACRLRGYQQSWWAV